MRVTVKADFSKARGNIKKWSEAKQKEVIDIVNESALNIQAGAKKRVSVNTGNLRASIAIEPASGKGFNLQVGTKVFYAPYVEWGTGIFAAHPTEPGRKTPWMFPVPTEGKVSYNFPIVEIDGKQFHLTRGSKPHPFLFPAAEEEKPKFYAAMRGVFK